MLFFRCFKLHSAERCAWKSLNKSNIVNAYTDRVIIYVYTVVRNLNYIMAFFT
jgi:hypothetical protein